MIIWNLNLTKSLPSFASVPVNLLSWGPNRLITSCLFLAKPASKTSTPSSKTGAPGEPIPILDTILIFLPGLYFSTKLPSWFL